MLLLEIRAVYWIRIEGMDFSFYLEKEKYKISLDERWENISQDMRPMLLANLPDSNLIFVYWQMSLQLFLVQNHFKLKEMKGN